MIRKLRAIAFFYKKLVVPSTAVSILFGMFGIITVGHYSFTLQGLAYIFIAPLFHFFIYELLSKNEYYFYYNLGFSRIKLYIVSILISILLGTSLILISI